jgi:hypothetical protein
MGLPENGTKSYLNMGSLADEFGQARSNVSLTSFHKDAANLYIPYNAGQSILEANCSREGAEYDGAINGSASGIPLVLPQHTKSRLRTSSTGTPSIVRGIPSTVNTQIKLGDFVGVSNGNPLVTDACGQTPTNRIFNSGRTGSVYRTNSSGRFKNVTGSQIAGTWKATTSNTWTTLNLGTVCAAGDVIVMLVSTAGGTLYAPTVASGSYQAAKFRRISKNGGSQIDNNWTQHLHRKDESGTDTWAACQSMVCTGDENRVQYYAHMSSSQPVLMHFFVLKGPVSGIICSAVKQTDNNSNYVKTETPGGPNNGITMFSSPFYNNYYYTTYGYTAALNGTGQIYYQSHTGSQTGAYAISLFCDEKRYSSSTDFIKGFSSHTYVEADTTPTVSVGRSNQDGEVFSLYWNTGI